VCSGVLQCAAQNGAERGLEGPTGGRATGHARRTKYLQIGHFSSLRAEGEGFEPSVDRKAHGKGAVCPQPGEASRPRPSAVARSGPIETIACAHKAGAEQPATRPAGGTSSRFDVRRAPLRRAISRIDKRRSGWRARGRRRCAVGGDCSSGRRPLEKPPCCGRCGSGAGMRANREPGYARVETEVAGFRQGGRKSCGSSLRSLAS
jgi:hypothetical protein